MSKKTGPPAAADDGARESSLASGWTVQADPQAVAPQVVPAAEDAATEHDDQSASLTGDAADQPDARTQLSNGALVLLGVFGGLFLMYAWGWFIVADAYSSLNVLVAAGSGLIGAILQQVIFWVAPAAPVLWFLVVAFMHRRNTAKLGVWLFLGAIVLIPLPMFVAVGGAA